MKKNQREITPLYISDAERCARQIVKESFAKILADIYHPPSLEQMISILKTDFEHSFDDFAVRRKIMKFHLDWSEDQIESELATQKRSFENELEVNLRVAALNIIEEIERLIRSLNSVIKKWKINNL